MYTYRLELTPAASAAEAAAGVRADAGDTIYHRGENFVDTLWKEARLLGIHIPDEKSRESRARARTRRRGGGGGGGERA